MKVREVGRVIDESTDAKTIIQGESDDILLHISVVQYLPAFMIRYIIIGLSP
jgi:hypothetical protein